MIAIPRKERGPGAPISFQYYISQTYLMHDIARIVVAQPYGGMYYKGFHRMLFDYQAARILVRFSEAHPTVKVLLLLEALQAHEDSFTLLVHGIALNYSVRGKEEPFWEGNYKLRWRFKRIVDGMAQKGIRVTDADNFRIFPFDEYKEEALRDSYSKKWRDKQNLEDWLKIIRGWYEKGI